AGELAARASLYVTLEPCSHHGRTPPCTDALIEAKVAAVHLALRDPSPWVDGGGIHALRDAGIAVEIGEREREATWLNEAYLKWVRTGLPFVTLKYAMTLDGKIATHTGSSRWITGPEARLHVARLRAQVDAVLVGIGTVLADDPQLTSRPGEFGGGTPPLPSPPPRGGRGLEEGSVDLVHQPMRVIVDTMARLPTTARVLDAGLPSKTLVCTTARAPIARREALVATGAEVVVLPVGDDGVDLGALFAELGRRQIISVLVEAGGTLTATLLREHGVDKVLAFVAPKIVGGRDAPTPVEGPGIADMAEALELQDPKWSVLGRDVLLTGYVA
ncbi:MAG TPA: bifunctional diaminohydroxyphosphoribosylaminopyrimidine deaminase/5-amino-6-(5-phosphoribosylamino)uracil reductase RibD, partial [Chloroflexota bacterium]